MERFPLYNQYNSYFMNSGCFNGSIGEIYNSRSHKVLNMSCKMWSCPKCRKRLKYRLFLETFYLVDQLELNKHFILTFGGEEYRKKYSFYDSYKIMSNNWDKFKKVIEYHKGKFDYILFPRAQNDGYCHYHVLLPKYISWYFLENKRKKYDEMGYLRINKNRDVAEYLHSDFFKDSEYWIPTNIKHYKSSRGIKFNKYRDPFFEDDNCMILGKHSVEDLEELVEDKFKCSLPNEYYLRKYYDNI